LPPYYGWFIAAGIAVSLVFWVRLARRDERLLVIYVGALVGAFVGAKLLYLLIEGWSDWAEPDRWRRLTTGKTILGALLGGYVGVELTKWQLGYRQATGDWFALILPAAIALGRIGCWLQGCCLGEVCAKDAWWTIQDQTGVPRWPAVPLEFIFNLVALGVFAWWGRSRLFLGQHFHIYLISYGLFRFGHEFFRATPRMIGPFSGYHFAALLVVALGVWGYRKRKREKSTRKIREAPGGDHELAR
jgi:phosphatidylglycerol:prolipoprotein diacylglycerol transferase